ncbi:hypothetical protein FRC01_000861 [Tulasnella sp. 417]|nr:hypothetical protein FRC01_000861 [Tulasnella sp. 417]
MSSSDPEHITLESKAACTALAFSPPGGGDGTFLVTGSLDGVIRVYQLPSTKVVRAVNGFGDEISSVAVCNSPPTNPKAEGGGDIATLSFWVACGRKVFLCDLGAETSKLVLSPSDARETLDLLEKEGDLLNQISLDSTAAKLAFTSDSGVVGVVDLLSENRDKRLLDAGHTSISNTVEFIPGWSTEVVSGGFDCKLQHFDLDSGTLLSSKTLGAAPSVSTNTSLSPPFVLCTAFSAGGCIAAGSADGRVYVGRKGAVGTDGKKVKRKGRWQGLLEMEASEGLNFEAGVLDGPVVGLEFLHQTKPVLLVLSLSGNVQLLSLRAPKQPNGPAKFEVLWQSQAANISKANALVSFATKDKGGGRWVTVAGVGKAGKGFVELMHLPQSILAKIG